MIATACALYREVLGIKRGKKIHHYVFVYKRRSAARSFVGTAVGEGEARHGTSASQGEKKCLRHLVRLERELYALLKVSRWEDHLLSPSDRLRSGAASNRDKGSPQNAAPMEAPGELSIEVPVDAPVEATVEATVDSPVDASVDSPLQIPNRLNKSVRKLHKWTPLDSKRNSIIARTVEEKQIEEMLNRMYTLMSRTALSKVLQLSEQVSNKGLYKTILMKYLHKINRRDRRGVPRGGSISWREGTTNQLLSLFHMCADYYVRMQEDRSGDTRIHTCEGNQFEDTPNVCREVIAALAQALRKKLVRFKLREMNDLVTALLRLRMVDPFVVSEDTTNDLMERFSSRLFRVNCAVMEAGRGGTRSECAAVETGGGSKDRDAGHVVDEEGTPAVFSKGEAGRAPPSCAPPSGAINLGDLAKLLYQLVTIQKRRMSQKEDSSSDRFTKEQTNLVNAILAYSKNEIKNGTDVKNKLFWPSCTSLLYSLTVLYSKKWHTDCIEIYDHAVRTYDECFDVDLAELVSLHCYDFSNFGKEHWPEEEVKRTCLLRSISHFCNSKAISIRFVLSMKEQPAERHTFLSLEELIKLTYAVTFFYKKTESSEEEIRTKWSHRVRGVISSLLLLTDGLVERAVLDVLPVGRQNDTDEGNTRGRALLKRLSHLANVYYEHHIGDMKVLCAITVLISKCRDVDLVVLSNILNIFTKLDFSYDGYFVCFFFSNCLGKGYLGEEVLRACFFQPNGGRQPPLSDHTDERNAVQKEKEKKPMAFYIWRAFIKCVKRSVADKQKWKDLSPVNITKLVNGLMHFKCLDKQSIEVLTKIILAQYTRGEAVGIINGACRNGEEAYQRAAKVAHFNLVSLGSLLNYMSVTDDIQCYEAKIKLVKMIAEKVVNRENSFDARLLCSIYISYARLNIHDVGLFYLIRKRLKSSQLNDLNLLSMLSYMNKAGIYDEGLLRTCFNNAFTKWRNKTKQRLSYAVHLLFILTSISQTFLFDSFHKIMCCALEIISYLYSVCKDEEETEKRRKKKKKLSYNFFSMLLISLHTFYHFFLDIHLGGNAGRVLDSVNRDYLNMFHFFLCQHWESVEGMGATNSQIQRNVLTALRQVVSKDVCISYEYALRGTPYLVDMVLHRGGATCPTFFKFLPPRASINNWLIRSSSSHKTEMELTLGDSPHTATCNSPVLQYVPFKICFHSPAYKKGNEKSCPHKMQQ
ncbi:hypothetical protein C922_02735 [Plasmodium inui San Antonio 1]|uniref:Uncharacterized protein n=1 Tax=Plasmodium inui San Antonio 1 TaxID=1237626 RepID=W7A4S9_9APIC|nr:hypothetical protein C922_02735 [Plasmodium inui San Antonio 1]EUD66750.1 hypothetical protein C922_02735 [Plasmodium inui San Antonio 1]